jgi:hypothetical protein
MPWGISMWLPASEPKGLLSLVVELKIASALNLAPLEKTFREGLAFDRFRLEFPG